MTDHAPWTKREEDRLRLWRAEGAGNVEIALRLERSISSVRAKVRALKLPPLRARRAAQGGGGQRARKLSAPRADKVTLPPLPSLDETP